MPRNKTAIKFSEEILADNKFFTKEGEFTLLQLAKMSDSELHIPAGSDKDDAFTIKDVAILSEAKQKDVSFFDNKKYLNDFLKSNAGACFISHKVYEKHKDQALPPNMALLVNSNPYYAYAIAVAAFYPSEISPATERLISTNASISLDAEIAENVIINDFAVVEANAYIGEGSIIEAGAIIKKGVTLGKNCKIGANATISHAIIGDNVSIYTGARIGQDGFGFAIDREKGFKKVIQLGRVIIENNCEIGANSCIDRGAGRDTIIGAGTWIDNMVHIAHNVVIGKNCVIVAHVGIAGSATIGDFVMIGGQVGVAGHINIGSGAKIAAQSGVMRDVPAGEEQLGSPALPIKQSMRHIAFLKKHAKT